MQILSIHLKNIKSHHDTELTFSPGINVLSGANGVGKSTVFEAIGYAMFGVDAQKFVGNIERFVSIGAKRGEIAVTFQLQEARYRVTRTVGAASKWLLAKQVAGEFEVEEHKDIKETEARLRTLLGLDGGRPLPEQFELVIGPFQHEFLGPFVIKQAAARRDKFDEILGIASWRKTFNETKALASTIKAKIDALQSALGPLKDQVEMLAEKRQEHKAAKLALKGAQESFAAQQTTLQGLEEHLAALDKREQELKALAVEIEQLKERIGNGKEMISNQKLLIDEAHKAHQIIGETAAGKLAYEQSERRLTELREQFKLQRQLEQEVARLDKQVSTLGERFDAEARTIEQNRAALLAEEQALVESRKALTVDASIRQLAERLPEVRDAINALRKRQGQLEGRRAGLEEGSEKLAEGICPFFQEACLNVAGKPPQDLFSSKFAELEKERLRLLAELDTLGKDEGLASQASDQLKELNIRIKGLEQQAAALAERRQANEKRAESLQASQAQQGSLQKQLGEKQQALQVYHDLQTAIDAAEQDKQQHQAARDLYVANQKQAAELAQRRAGLEKLEQFLQQLRGELEGKAAAHKLAGQAYDSDAHERLRRQKDELRREVGALEQKVKGLLVDVARLAGELDKLKLIEQEIAAKQEMIKGYVKKEELVKFLRNKVFRHVSGYLSERYREEISQRANRIYRIIAEVDEELCWGDDYRIVLRDMVDGEMRERNDDQLSGGQTMSAVVALRLAMLQTIGARIAFFDEPTSNLDATRRENLAHAFRAIDVGKEEVTEHWYDQLFLISHDVAFTEVTDQILTLE